VTDSPEVAQSRDERVPIAAPNQDSLEDFRVVFEEHASYVWSSLRRLGVREADAEDVMHEVFLIVHRSFDTYDRQRPMRPWLFGIACRAALAYRRLARNHRELLVPPNAPEPPDSAPFADEVLSIRQNQRLVLEALDALDFDQRVVFVRHEIDGAPIPEVAVELAIPENTAYSRLRLGRKRFYAAVSRLKQRRGTP